MGFGEGRGGGIGAPFPFTVSEAEESTRGRVPLWLWARDAALLTALLWVMIVGEDVCWRPIRGRCSRSLRCLREEVAPGEGRGGIWPVFSTAMDRGWSGATRLWCASRPTFPRDV